MPFRLLVNLEELMFMHSAMVDRYGGSIGVRDQGLLESALARPLSSFGGQPLHNVREILGSVDAVMVARGDLGV
ncbi:MAG: hypothetical protein ACREP9_11650 [Candidatus Dormibacteraceae bacterium]